MQFMTASSSSATTSWLREAESSANGSRASGHARTQRPQRMQAVSSGRTAASCRATMALLALRIGQSMFVMVRPIMGPPMMIFFGSLIMPPVASMTSRTLMPSGMR